MAIMLNRLEVYAAILLVIGLAIGGSYFKGRMDEKASIRKDELAANAAALKGLLDDAQQLAVSDAAGRQAADAFAARMRQGLSNVVDQFSKIPNVVVDASGCGRLSDGLRLRWNAAEGLPTGSALERPGAAPGAVPTASGAPP